jgi:peptidylprolyl isomerase
MRRVFSKIWFVFLFPFIVAFTGENSMDKHKVVIFETTQGVIELTLKPDVAPKACENFIKLVEKHYYDGIVFHRIIKDFMIQGGDPTGTGRGGQSAFGKAFEDECSSVIRFDRPGLLAMANAGPNTNGSQFFITTANTPWLNMKHTIFGEVTKGMENVRKLESTKVGPQDRPQVEQKIIRAYLKG